MTKAALETLAIVAYKQPVTRRKSAMGVNADGVLRALDRGLEYEAAKTGLSDIRSTLILADTQRDIPDSEGLASLAALPSLAPLLDASAGPADAADRAADPEDEPGDQPEGQEDVAEPTADPDESGPDTPEG
jgi:hypothetical protein